jgi:septal ring factor EnvC (AmiA/AmiB activator)
MAIFRLLSKKVQKSMSEAEVELINVLNRLDPETVQEFQIEEYERHLDVLTKQMVKAEASLKKEKAEADAINANFLTKKEEAAKLVAAIEDPNTSPEKKAKFEAHLETLVPELEEMKAQIPEEEEDVVNAQSHYNLLKEAVENAAKKLVTARKNLTKKQNELKRLDDEQKRAKDREEQQKALIGLATKVDKFSGVVDAMDKEIAKKKEAIAASKAKTDAIKRVSPGGGSQGLDADVAALLKKDEPPKQSATERFKNL